MRERKTAQILALEGYPQPHLPAAGRRWREENPFYLAAAVPAGGKVMPREGCDAGRAPAGTEGMGGCWLHPAQGTLTRTSTCSPGRDGATPEHPESQNGDPSAHGIKHCHHQRPGHHENRLWPRPGKGKRSKDMGTPLPPRVLTVSPGSQAPPAAGDHNVRKEGTHTRVVAAIQTRKAKLPHVGRDREGNGSLMMAVGPRASPAALR